MADLAGFLVRSAGLVLVLFVLSRLPMVRTLFYRRELDPKGRVVYVLFWYVASLVAPNLTVLSAFVPFFAGIFGDLGGGMVVGAAAGLTFVLLGHSLPTGLVHLLAGWLGGRLGQRLGPGRPLAVWVAVVAGALSLMGMDAPDHPGLWMGPPVLLSGLPQLPYMLMAFSLTSYAFMRLMEFLLTEGERERARTADRVLTMVEDVERLLKDGLDAQSAVLLADKVRVALDVPACVILTDVVAFAGPFAHTGMASSLPGEGEVPHQHLFTECPKSCPYTLAQLVPLQDGLRTVGMLALLGTRTAALSPSASGTLRGLSSLLSGHLSEARVRAQKADLEVARFQFLQAQIRPHFLFNALNTVAAIAPRDGMATRGLVLHLARVLRESFQQERALISLSEELGVVRSYLAIEQARYGERLRVVFDIPEPIPTCTVPPFTLQPLVENAVRHGTAECLEGGEVRVGITSLDGHLEVTIADDGAGMTSERLERVLHGGTGVGVSNVRERLASLFGTSVQFDMKSAPGRGTCVTLALPLGEG